ncbi:hypothetical protein MPSEU_000525900 [Mayamaea pseudoterrestris]|nr:hypothetical protein MPSEU_000525900 [Mayamaea pseudoterrestris]
MNSHCTTTPLFGSPSAASRMNKEKVDVPAGSPRQDGTAVSSSLVGSGTGNVQDGSHAPAAESNGSARNARATSLAASRSGMNDDDWGDGFDGDVLVLVRDGTNGDGLSDSLQLVNGGDSLRSSDGASNGASNDLIGAFTSSGGVDAAAAADHGEDDALTFNMSDLDAMKHKIMAFEAMARVVCLQMGVSVDDINKAAADGKNMKLPKNVFAFTLEDVFKIMESLKACPNDCIKVGEKEVKLALMDYADGISVDSPCGLKYLREPIIPASFGGMLAIAEWDRFNAVDRLSKSLTGLQGYSKNHVEAFCKQRTSPSMLDLYQGSAFVVHTKEITLKTKSLRQAQLKLEKVEKSHAPSLSAINTAKIAFNAAMEELHHLDKSFMSKINDILAGAKGSDVASIGKHLYACYPSFAKLDLQKLIPLALEPITQEKINWLARNDLPFKDCMDNLIKEHVAELAAQAARPNANDATLQQHDGRLTSLEGRHDATENRIDMHDGHLKQLNKSNKIQANVNELIHFRIEQNKDTLKAHDVRLGATEANVQELRKDLGAHGFRQYGTELKVQQMGGDLAAHGARHDATEARQDVLEGKVQQMGGDLVAHGARHDATEARQDVLEGKVQQMGGDLEAHGARQGVLEGKVQQMGGDLASHGARQEVLEGTVQHMIQQDMANTMIQQDKNARYDYHLTLHDTQITAQQAVNANQQEVNAATAQKLDATTQKLDRYLIEGQVSIKLLP